MGWNAGAFGTMTFPDAKSVEDWKKTTVSPRDFDDWVNELENFFDDELNVGKAIKSLSKLKHTHFELNVKGSSLELLFDGGEDTFRDFGGQLALLLRAGAVCGATGVFHFLGTAGAEYDFTYELKLAKGRSTLKALGKAGIAKVYESDAYAAFNETVMARLMDADPSLKKLLKK